jgi:nucleoside-diphosphate-sugar epimerase
VKELATMMLNMAQTYQQYQAFADKVKLIETTSDNYYGKGYQDIPNRVPNIDNTQQELHWSPQVNMQQALAKIFDAYRDQVADARGLMEINSESYCS